MNDSILSVDLSLSARTENVRDCYCCETVRFNLEEIYTHFVENIEAINEYNAVLTRSGRGSAVSFYVNRLLGLTEIDRLKSPITLYPTRFMSAERILSSRSLPD